MNPSTAILFIGGDNTAYRSVQVLSEKLTPCRLDFARDEADALARLSTVRYATIIVDATGPLGQVEPLLLKIRKTHDATPVILLTDHSYSADDFSLAEAHGIMYLIPKPIQVQEHLIFSVKKALESGRLTSELAQAISRWVSGNLNARHPKEELQGPAVTESDAYETVDIEAALRIMNGKENILLRCFELFMEILPPTLENIAHAIDTPDETALNRSLHKFKGTLKNIAAKRAVHIAGLIENAGKEGDMVAAGKHLEALVLECENIKAFISRRKNEALPN